MNNDDGICWLCIVPQAMLASKISVGADDGGRYLVADLVGTIRSSFGASPLLLCEGGSLQELRLCFDKDLKVIHSLASHVSYLFVYFCSNNFSLPDFFQPLDCINGGNGSEYDITEHGRYCPRYISLPSYKPRGKCWSDWFPVKVENRMSWTHCLPKTTIILQFQVVTPVEPREGFPQT